MINLFIFKVEVKEVWKYLRFVPVDALGNITTDYCALVNIRVFSAINQGGIEYPATALTSRTSESGLIISSGHFQATYEDWEAFDGENAGIGDAWWSLGSTISTNWLQMAWANGVEIKSFTIQSDGQFTQTPYLKIYASNTGLFTGEETLLVYANSYNWSTTGTRIYSFNID